MQFATFQRNHRSQKSKSKHRALGLLASASIAVIGLSDYVLADSTTWIDTDAIGTWQTPGNWSGGLLPSTTTDALFNQNISSTVHFNADASDALTTISSGTVAFALDGRTLTLNALDVSGAKAFSFDNGTITVQYGGVLAPPPNATGVMDLSGSSAAGAILSLARGAIFQLTKSAVSNTLYIGNAGNRGTLLVDATGSFRSSNFGQVTAGQNIMVGLGRSASGSVAGSGTLDVSGAASTIAYSIAIGSGGGIGYASADGNNSQLSASAGYLDVGSGGFAPPGQTFIPSVGALSVTNGAISNGNSTVRVGYQGGTGTTIIDGYSVLFGTTIDVGDGSSLLGTGTRRSSSGTLLIRNRSSVVADQNVWIGINGGTGTVSVDGSSTGFQTGNVNFEVGWGSSIDGATTSRSNGNLLLTSSASGYSKNDTNIGRDGGAGSLTVSGATFTVGGALRVGYAPGATNGTMSISGAGTLAVNQAGSLTTPVAVIGAYQSYGTVSLSDAGTIWKNTGNLFIGNDSSRVSIYDGHGTVNIGQGALLNNTAMLNVYSGGTLIINGGQLSTGSLNVLGGHVQVIAAGANHVLSKIPSFSIELPGVVDLTDNDAVIASGTAKTAIEAYVKLARDNGKWDNTGITTSLAKPDFGSSTLKPTGLGVLSGAEFKSVGGATVFDGFDVAASDTLIKYTWNGDADLNGKINADDYGHIDSGYQNQHNTGFVFDWFTGDFDYNGVINADDYALIDSAYQLQDGTLRAALSAIESGATSSDDPAVAAVLSHEAAFGDAYVNAFLSISVPEPASTILFPTGIALLATRRRRRV